MQSIPLVDLIPETVAAHGALDFDYRGDGLSPRRLPAWTRAQLSIETDVMVRMPSGVRLRFKTDSTRIGISFLATAIQVLPNERRPITFSLEEDGRLTAGSSVRGNTIVLQQSKPGEFDLVRGEADTVWFEDLSPDGVYELWLPHNAFLELRAFEIEAGASIFPAEADPRPRWIHYGSSISHCMEAEQPGETWPAVAARRAGVALQNLGLAGQCHLDQFVARTIRDSDAEIISLKLGINIVNADSMRERVFGSALHGFLDTIREGQPDAPIIVTSPIHCPSAEQNPGPTISDEGGKFRTFKGNDALRVGCLSLVRIREIISEIVERRRADGDDVLQYFDGLQLFGQADAGDLPDDLHPNPAGYIRMGERFADLVLSPILQRR